MSDEQTAQEERAQRLHRQIDAITKQPGNSIVPPEDRPKRGAAGMNPVRILSSPVTSTLLARVSYDAS